MTVLNIHSFHNQIEITLLELNANALLLLRGMIKSGMGDVFILYNELHPILLELDINPLHLLRNPIELTLLELNISALILPFGVIT